jgi:MFS family permease
MSPISRGFRALKTRNYRLFWVGQTVSQVGSWMQMTAQGWLVLQLSKSPFEVGLVTALQFTPAMLLSLFGGALADRVDRHKMLFATQCAAAIQALLFAILVSSKTIQIGHVFALAFLLGLINAFDNPTRQAFVPSLVPRDDLPNAIAMNSLIINVARVIGPSLAGILIATIGMPAAFWTNFASYIGILAALGLMDRSQMELKTADKGQSVLAGIKEVLVVIAQRPPVMLPLILMAFFGTFGYNFNTFIPMIGGFVLKVDPVQYGGLTSSQGVGAVIGALTIGFLGKPRPLRLFLAAAAFATVLALVASIPIYWATAILLGLLGTGAVMLATSCNTTIQLGVPDHLRGRAMSVYWMVFAGSTPIGALFVGWAARQYGVPMGLFLCSMLCFFGTLVGVVYWLRNRASWNPKQEATSVEP